MLRLSEFSAAQTETVCSDSSQMWKEWVSCPDHLVSVCGGSICNSGKLRWLQLSESELCWCSIEVSVFSTCFRIFFCLIKLEPCQVSPHILFPLSTLNSLFSMSKFSLFYAECKDFLLTRMFCIKLSFHIILSFLVKAKNMRQKMAVK